MKRAKVDSTQPFDFDAPPEVEEVPQSEWQEVPQALFLSWSPAMQAAYCAARDEDSAQFAETYDEALWYLARAAAYKETYAL